MEVPVLCLGVPTELPEFCHAKPGDGLAEVAHDPEACDKVDIEPVEEWGDVPGNDEALWPFWLGLCEYLGLFHQSVDSISVHATNRSKLGCELEIVFAHGQSGRDNWELVGEEDGREEFEANKRVGLDGSDIFLCGKQ
jgi:hypothetical protein